MSKKDQHIPHPLLFDAEEMGRITPGDIWEEKNQPVTCLGMEFPNDDARREHFREELRKKLPELRQIEGFPIGKDEDIIRLSDPPYYTACPNPWLNDFIAEWEEEKKVLLLKNKRNSSFKVEEPYADDITGIKNDSVYRSLVYHTKVPQEIIMKFLLYYTQPGDIVLDGFGGTGMTGLACQSCENPPSDLKNKVNSENVKWGRRHCICGDLSSYASTIAYNVNSPAFSKLITNEVKRIYEEITKEIGWMYITKHRDGNNAEINCVIYSDVVVCPHCGKHLVLWNYTVDKANKKLHDSINCPFCSTTIKTDSVQKAVETYYDDFIHTPIGRKKSVPVRVIYTYKGKRYEKAVDSDDIDLINKIENYDVSSLWFPTTPMMGVGEQWGDTWRSGVHTGMTHVHHFYTRRNLIFLATFYKKISQSPYSSKLMYLFTSMIMRSTTMNRVHFTKYLSGGSDWDAGHLKGTMYVPSYSVESSVLAQIRNKLQRFSKAAPYLPSKFDNAIMIASANNNGIANDSIDYIFVDPPFGANIMYSELNYISESWLKVTTNNIEEAIEDTTHNKDHIFYSNKMYECFAEFYRVLKPGKWMTVEFSNTSASVWNSIQTAIVKAGFIIANVSALNKGQGGMRSVTTTTAVKQDLAISCYKPSKQVTEKIGQNSDKSVWDLVDEHLHHVAVFQKRNTQALFITERDPRIIYDRLISYYVLNGLSIPLNSRDFQDGLKERFLEIDGMYFTATQAVEYEEKRKNTDGFAPMGIIVSDEANGIEWLKNLLRDTPKTYQQIQPEWMKAISGVRKGDILPELKEILEDNFIEMPDGKWRLQNVQDDADKETMRTKKLLKIFRMYVEQANKPKAKIKDARREALRAGFKQCYIDKEFQTIVTVGDKIPQNLLTEDEVLLQFYDIAQSKL